MRPNCSPFCAGLLIVLRSAKRSLASIRRVAAMAIGTMSTYRYGGISSASKGSARSGWNEWPVTSASGVEPNLRKCASFWVAPLMLLYQARLNRLRKNSLLGSRDTSPQRALSPRGTLFPITPLAAFPLAGDTSKRGLGRQQL